MALRPSTSLTPSKANGADKSAQQDVFLREVDDALRQDEMLGFAQRYGRPIGVIVVAGLLGFAGFLWYQNSQKAAEATRGEQFTMALDSVQSTQLDAGDKALAALADKGGPAAAAAQMMRAGIAMEQGHRDTATKLYSAVAADSSAPQPYRDLATIRDVAARFDTMAPEQVIDRLRALAQPGNAWFGSAGELIGMAYLKQGRKDLAGPMFAAIAKDKAAPETLRQRSRELAGLLGVDAVEDSALGMGAAPGDRAPALVPPKS